MGNNPHWQGGNGQLASSTFGMLAFNVVTASNYGMVEIGSPDKSVQLLYLNPQAATQNYHLIVDTATAIDGTITPYLAANMSQWGPAPMTAVVESGFQATDPLAGVGASRFRLYDLQQSADPRLLFDKTLSNIGPVIAPKGSILRILSYTVTVDVLWNIAWAEF